ncbi:MAG: HtaA domain-containing protein [Solirubrobacterales bacterium]
MRFRYHLTALAAAVAALALSAPPAVADTVTGGSATWGVKESFRSYVTGPVAMGQISTSNGATVNGDGTFNFQPGSGTFDPATGKADAKFGGTVLFTGHMGALRLQITDPRVTYQGNAGTLYADVVSRDFNTAQDVSYPNVDLASLDLTGITPSVDGSTASVSNIPAKLTANGAEAFADFYSAGEDLDPVSLSFTYTPNPVLGSLTAGDKKQKVSDARREVQLAQVECQASSCDLSATPAKINAEIAGGPKDGKKFKVRVVAPAQVNGGASASVVAKLSKGTVRKLAKGGKAVLETTVDLSSGSLSDSVDAKVKIKAQKVKKPKRG